MNFRSPNDDEIRKKWIDAIKHANNDNYQGGGLVCCQHFLPDEISRVGRLKQGSIPSIFMVDVIQMDEDMVDDCDGCENLRSEINDLKLKLTKFSLDSSIKEMKMLRNIEKKNLSSKKKWKKM